MESGCWDRKEGRRIFARLAQGFAWGSLFGRIPPMFSRRVKKSFEMFAMQEWENVRVWKVLGLKGLRRCVKIDAREVWTEERAMLQGSTN